MIKDRAPDILVLDAMLPEVHGFEIARRLRTSKRYQNLPIIMVSAVYRGWRFAEDLRDSCGVEHYLEKPFRDDDVRSAVAAALAEASERELTSESLVDGAEQALVDGMAAFREGRVADAVLHLERGVAIDPLAYRLHFNLGLLFAQTGRTYDAIRALERAVEINSSHFAGVKNLAIMYGQAGFRNRAVELWERGLALAPDDGTREAIQQHLAGLLSQDGLS
jgi:DNA-binding response OmpR family regulator